MERSCFTLDLGAIRRNAATLLKAAEGAQLWAVVKAEGYGHGAVDVSKAALDAGATARASQRCRRRSICARRFATRESS